MIDTKIFNQFIIELINVETGEIAHLTTPIRTYKELAEYLTKYEKRKWRMSNLTRKED